MKSIKLLMLLVVIASMVSCHGTDCYVCQRVVYFNNTIQDTIESSYFCGEDSDREDFHTYIISKSVSDSGIVTTNQGELLIEWICND